MKRMCRVKMRILKRYCNAHLVFSSCVRMKFCYNTAKNDGFTRLSKLLKEQSIWLEQWNHEIRILIYNLYLY